MTARFVILTHDQPYLHWDLMLEESTELLTWRLFEEPTSTQRIAAEELPPHRKHYLDYEGPVSESRGSVQQWDTGTYQILSSREGYLEIHLQGEKQQCQAILSRNSPKNEWTFQLIEISFSS
jgi:hypothetical protein